MKKLFIVLALILGLSTIALAEHPFPFGKSDTVRLLNKAFSVTDGHDHDGVNSKGISFPDSFELEDGKIIVGSALDVGAPVALSGDATIVNTGALTIANNAITSAKILDGTIVNADIAANAVIDYSKLATLDSAYMLVGSSTGVATKRAITGDVAISNTGVTTVGSITAALTLSTQDLSTSDADPGIGVANLTTLVTLITSDDTGSVADEVSLADGVKGQIKILILKVDGEATGTKIIPAHFANGTSILFEDAGDGCILIFDGTNWSLVANIGGTIS